MRHADGCDVMMNRVMTKDNIALAVLLETKEAAWETPPSQPDQVRNIKKWYNMKFEIFENQTIVSFP